MTRVALPENYQVSAAVEVAPFQTETGVVVNGGTTIGSFQYGDRLIVTDTRADTGGIYVQWPLDNFTFAAAGIDTTKDWDIGALAYLGAGLPNAGFQLRVSGLKYLQWGHNTTTQGTIITNQPAYSAHKLSGYSVTGGCTLSDTFTAFRFYIDTVTGGGTIGCGGFWVNQRARTKIVLTWDDSIEDAYTVGYARLQPYGMKGTVFMLPETYWGLTSGNIATMVAAGWEFALHGPIDATSVGLVTKYSDDYDDMRADIQAVWDDMEANGVPVSPHYAYPLGENSETLRQVLTDMGIRTGRLAGSAVCMPTVPMWPDLMRVQAVSGTTSYVATKGHIDRAVKAGTSLILIHHATTDADFVQVAAYLNQLQQQGLLDVVTMAEFYDGLEGRRVTVSRVA